MILTASVPCLYVVCGGLFYFSFWVLKNVIQKNLISFGVIKGCINLIKNTVKTVIVGAQDSSYYYHS